MPNTVTSTPVRCLTVFAEWQVDAITTSSMQARPRCTVLVYPGKTVFVLCCTSNPHAISLQRYPRWSPVLLLQIVKESRNWGTPETRFGSGNYRTWFLVWLQLRTDSAVAEGGNLNILAAGLNANGDGLLILVPQRYPVMTIQLSKFLLSTWGN